MTDSVHALQSDEASPQPQVPTPAEGQEETIPKTRPEEASVSEGGDPSAATGEETLGDVTQMTPSATTTTSLDKPAAATESPAVEDNTVGASENSNVGSTFTAREFDQPTGSGMMSPFSEEEDTSPTVGETDETQPPTDDEPQKGKIEPGRVDAITERKKNTAKATHTCYK